MKLGVEEDSEYQRSIDLSIYLSIDLSIYLSIHPSIHPSIYLYVMQYEMDQLSSVIMIIGENHWVCWIDMAIVVDQCDTVRQTWSSDVFLKRKCRADHEEHVDL